jgi:hypothetical protein
MEYLTGQSQVAPISLADSMQQWGNVRDSQMARDQRIKDQPMVDQQNKMKIGLQQHQAAKEVSSEFLSALDSHAKRMGVQPDTPEYQQLANQVYHTGNYAGTMQNITGKPYDPSANIDVNAARAIAGSTPGEQAQAEIDQAVAKDNALFSNKAKLAEIQAGDYRSNVISKITIKQNIDDNIHP